VNSAPRPLSLSTSGACTVVWHVDRSAPTIAGNRVFYNDNMVGAKNKVVKSHLQFRMEIFGKKCLSSEEK
jgi:hypothetical protein